MENGGKTRLMRLCDLITATKETLYYSLTSEKKLYFSHNFQMLNKAAVWGKYQNAIVVACKQGYHIKKKKKKSTACNNGGENIIGRDPTFDLKHMRST